MKDAIEVKGLHLHESLQFGWITFFYSDGGTLCKGLVSVNAKANKAIKSTNSLVISSVASCFVLFIIGLFFSKMQQT